jgi:hypothetical protein
MPSWNEGVSLKRILTKLSNRTAPLAHLPEMPAERSLEYHALCWPMPYHLGPLRVAGEPTKEEMTLVVNEIRPDPSPEIRELVYRTLGAVQQRGQCDWLEQSNGVSIYVIDIRSDEITGQFSAVDDIVSVALHVKYSALKRLVIANASYEIADVKFFDPTVADALFLESVSRRRGKGRSVTEAMQALLAGWCVWAGKQRVQGQFIPSLKDVLMQEGSIRDRDCINAYEEEFNRANKEKRGEKPWSSVYSAFDAARGNSQDTLFRLPDTEEELMCRFRSYVLEAHPHYGACTPAECLQVRELAEGTIKAAHLSDWRLLLHDLTSASAPLDRHEVLEEHLKRLPARAKRAVSERAQLYGAIAVFQEFLKKPQAN